MHFLTIVTAAVASGVAAVAAAADVAVAGVAASAAAVCLSVAAVAVDCILLLVFSLAPCALSLIMNVDGNELLNVACIHTLPLPLPFHHPLGLLQLLLLVACHYR